MALSMVGTSSSTQASPPLGPKTHSFLSSHLHLGADSGVRGSAGAGAL